MSWWKVFDLRYNLARGRPMRASCRLSLEELEPRLAPSVTVPTYHNDNSSTGLNPAETILTPSNVNPTTFGKLFTANLDGQVYAEPLYMANVNITTGPSPGSHNVVFVATEHDSLYALDATTGNVLWHTSFIDPAHGVTSVPNMEVNNPHITPELGITGTPVIDPSTNSIYAITYTKEVVNGNNHYVYRLHAVSLSNGSEQFGGPLLIADMIKNPGQVGKIVSGPSVNGTGTGSANGQLTFKTVVQLQRPGLTLVNGTVFAAFGSNADANNYHGWVMAFNHADAQQKLQLIGVFNTTPNGDRGAIWQSGGKLAADAAGNVYVETANGTVDSSTNSKGFLVNGDYSNSFLKIALDPTTNPTHQNANGWGLKLVDYFTPYNAALLNKGDHDLGSGAPVLLPDAVGSAAHPHLLIGGGKKGVLYLIDINNMGGFSATTDHVVQEVQANSIYGTPAYFNGRIYDVGVPEPPSTEQKPGLAFSIANGVISTAPVAQTPDLFTWPGSTPSISANNNTAGIVWDLNKGTNELRAYEAANYNDELYTSSEAANGRDQLGTVIKFTTPMIANGRVYVPTAAGIVAYGLLS